MSKHVAVCKKVYVQKNGDNEFYGVAEGQSTRVEHLEASNTWVVELKNIHDPEAWRRLAFMNEAEFQESFEVLA